MGDELDRMREANAQLDRYASLVAHDLQAPARRIVSFAQLLQDELVDPSETVAEYLDYILLGASQLASQIAALLEFSRVAPHADLGPVDLSAVAREVLAELATEIERTGAQVEVADLGTSWGAPRLMRSVLRHVIGNALQHHGPGVPHLRVLSHPPAADEPEPLLHLVVEDDGPGIPPGQRQRVFEPLQRLSAPPSTGSGMGLAITRRAVAAQGGRIWLAEPESGTGTAVWVALPVHD